MYQPYMTFGLGVLNPRGLTPLAFSFPEPEIIRIKIKVDCETWERRPRRMRAIFSFIFGDMPNQSARILAYGVRTPCMKYYYTLSRNKFDYLVANNLLIGYLAKYYKGGL